MTLRDQFATCPRCAIALDTTADRKTCGRCHGVFMTEAALVTIIADLVRHTRPALDFSPPHHDDPLRSCPECASRMSKHGLHDIEVDRCEAHGVWFDHGELQDVFHQVGLDDLASAPLAERAGKRAGAITRALVAALWDMRWKLRP